MSKLILTIFYFFLTIWTESIYTFSVMTIEGNNKHLSSCQGKKILVITLPTQHNNSNDSLLHSLDSLKGVYTNSLIIIAAPSYEDGYTTARRNELKQWYRSILRQSIIITEGVFTRKTSGSQQHPLFNWLTTKSRNGHFDKDVVGPRDKFIVWSTGELIGVLGAHTKINSSAMNSLLSTQ